MRAHRWIGAAGLLAITLSLSGCSYQPRYAATINHLGHVQVEQCFGGDMVVTVSHVATLVIDDRDSPRPRVVDLETADASQWVLGPTSIGESSTIRVWSASRFGGGREPDLSFRVEQLEAGTYWYAGGSISPAAWAEKCDIDDSLSKGALIGLAIGGLLCIASVIAVLAWCIRAVLRRRPNAHMPGQPR